VHACRLYKQFVEQQILSRFADELLDRGPANIKDLLVPLATDSPIGFKSAFMNVSRSVSQIGFRVLLRQLSVSIKRLHIFLPAFLHPFLGAIQIPQVVEYFRYVRQIGLRVFLCRSR